MAKCTITFEDGEEPSDDFKVYVELNPPPVNGKGSYAQHVGWSFFKRVQDLLEIEDSELQDHLNDEPPRPPSEG